MFVETKSSKSKMEVGESHETYILKCKKKDGICTGVNNDIIETNRTVTNKFKQSSNYDDWNIKKLRYDIIKFGTLGFDAEKKLDSKIALAVSLGAKSLKINGHKTLKNCKGFEKKVVVKKIKNKASLTTMKKKKSAVFHKSRDINKGLLYAYGKMSSSKHKIFADGTD